MPTNRLLPGEGPLYLRVRDHVVAMIVDGHWQPGDALPSELQLAAEFGVSQGTLRKALDSLVAENLLLRQQGKGTFVTTHTPQRELFHFFHLVGEDGARELPTVSRVLSIETRRATADENARLQLPRSASVIHIRRLRELGGRPVIVEEISVPARLFKGLAANGDDLPNALYALYEEFYGITVRRAVEHLRAVIATAAEAMLLNLPKGAPLIEIDRLGETLDGTPVEWRLSRCDTQSHAYRSEID